MIRLRWFALAALLVPVMLVGLVIVPRSLHAATLHVSSCSGDAATGGSLGNVIGASSSGDTILFDQDCTVTPTATLTIPATKNLILDANQHTVTLDGGNTRQILRLAAVNNHGPTVTLTGLTFQHGNAAQGGAIFNDQGTLTILASAIVTNTATDSGGGIENAGGTLTITNSTFFGNRVTGTTQATGGAIDNNAFGKVTLVSSTISGNSVSSPAAQSASGGGIFDFATAVNSLTLTATIVAGNEGGNCNGVEIGSANPNGITSGGHNLIGVRHSNAGDPNCGVDFASVAGANGEQIGTDAAPLNAKLGPLGMNGGHTPTLALLLGSPAIDAGGATCPAGVTTDQRGQPRPVGAGCDIGAVESNLTVTSVAVSVTAGGATTLKVGQTAQLKATATYSDSETADVTGQVTWSSDATAIATVSAAGVVTGQSAGNANVSAKIGTTTGTVAVTVTGPTPIGIQVPPAPSGRPSGTTSEGTATPAPVPVPRSGASPASGASSGSPVAPSGPAPNPLPTGR